MPCKNCKKQGRFGCACDDMEDCDMFDDYIVRHIITGIECKNRKTDWEWIRFNEVIYKSTLSPEQRETMDWASTNIESYFWENSSGFRKHMRRQCTTPNEEDKGAKPAILHKMEEDTP
jgi:hypothetical protein